MKIKTVIIAAAVFCGLGGVAGTYVPKPVDVMPKVPLLVQTEVRPEGLTEDPYVEVAPPIVPTQAEQAAQMVIFSRPLTEPIWQNTNPQRNECIERLDSWGARGQFITLNFAVYPLKELKGLKVRVVDSEVKPEIRLVRYWDIIYPSYNSHLRNAKVKRYRRMPEFLAPVSECDATAKEPQRFYLTFKLPMADCSKIQGSILVFHEGFDKALKVPFSIKVLPFELKQDPNKHYSAYLYQVRTSSNPFFKANKDNPEKLHKAQLNEFRKMRDYGFTRPPTFMMSIGTLPDGTKDAYNIPFLPELLAELKEAGFPPNASIPVAGGSATSLYQRFTGHKLNSFHMDNIECDRIPDELYTVLDGAIDKFLKYAKSLNCPPIIFNPIDEPSAAAYPYVKNFYEVFKKRGLTTFLTSPPKNYAPADHLFDIYNFGAYNVPYEVAVSGKKIEYWCYPNDNAYQKKDPYIMCHGGRMTYGFGYWRSGFHCIIPWIWRNSNPNRLCNSGGNLLTEDGDLILTTYWESFRLGVDDLRYIYTLQDAIVKREKSRKPAAKKAVSEAKAVLQNIWNRICPQPAYLADNLLPHEEMDAMRAEMANMILKLHQIPAASNDVAPSVIIDTNGKYVSAQENLDAKNIIVEPIHNWPPQSKEMTVKEKDGKVDVKIAVNHREGDKPGDQYPIGWPRLRHTFGKTGDDFTRFTYFEFDLTVSSDRNIEDDYSWNTRLNVVTKNGEVSEFEITNRLEPGIKHRIRVPISKFIPISRAGLQHLSHIQLVMPEAYYPDGSNLSLIYENIRCVGFSKPTILGMETPASLALPVNDFSCPANVGGLTGNKAYKVLCEMLDGDKVLCASEGCAIDTKVFCRFDSRKLKCGNYIIRMTLFDENGQKASSMTKPVIVFNGPNAR